MYELGKLGLGWTQETNPDLIFLGNFKAVLLENRENTH